MCIIRISVIRSIYLLGADMNQERKAKIILAQLRALQYLYYQLFPNEKCVDIVLEKDSISVYAHSATDEKVYHG